MFYTSVYLAHVRVRVRPCERARVRACVCVCVTTPCLLAEWKMRCFQKAAAVCLHDVFFLNNSCQVTYVL